MKSLAIISPLECTGTAVLVRTYTTPPCMHPHTHLAFVPEWVLGCCVSYLTKNGIHLRPQVLQENNHDSSSYIDKWMFHQCCLMLLKQWICYQKAVVSNYSMKCYTLPTHTRNITSSKLLSKQQSVWKLKVLQCSACEKPLQIRKPSYSYK